MVRTAPLALLALAGCTPELEITNVQDYCTDYDFDSPQVSEVVATVTPDLVTIARTYVVEPAGSEWGSKVTIEGRVLRVHEAWTLTEESNDLCYQPSIAIAGLTGKLEVRWFTDETDVPYQTIDVEAQ